MSDDNRFIDEQEADMIKRHAQGTRNLYGCYQSRCSSCGSYNTIEGTFGVECFSCGSDNYYEREIKDDDDF